MSHPRDEMDDLPRFEDLPELQIVEVPREIERWPAAIIINPPIDSEGRYVPRAWIN